MLEPYLLSIDLKSIVLYYFKESFANTDIASLFCLFKICETPRKSK